MDPRERRMPQPQPRVSVTEYRAVRKKARESVRDPLTNLPGRELMSRAVERQLGVTEPPKAGSALVIKPRPFSVLWFDIRGMHPVNDNLGFPEGDKVKVAAAQSMRGRGVPALMGGDEFAVLVSSNNMKRIRRIQNRIRADFALKVRENPEWEKLGVGLHTSKIHVFSTSSKAGEGHIPILPLFAMAQKATEGRHPALTLRRLVTSVMNYSNRLEESKSGARDIKEAALGETIARAADAGLTGSALIRYIEEQSRAHLNPAAFSRAAKAELERLRKRREENQGVYGDGI